MHCDEFPPALQNLGLHLILYPKSIVIPLAEQPQYTLTATLVLRAVVILGFEVRVAQQGILKNSELSMKLSWKNWSHSIKTSRDSENTIKLSPFRKIPSKEYNVTGISHSVTFGGDAVASVVLVSNHCSQIADGRRFPDAAQDVGLGSRRRGRVGRRATAPRGGDGARGALRARRRRRRVGLPVPLPRAPRHRRRPPRLSGRPRRAHLPPGLGDLPPRRVQVPLPPRQVWQWAVSVWPRNLAAVLMLGVFGQL